MSVTGGERNEASTWKQRRHLARLRAFRRSSGGEAMNGVAAKNLPQFVRDLLASGPPPAGEGVNLWLFRMARVLHPYRGELEIADILRASVAGCGRVVTE